MLWAAILAGLFGGRAWLGLHFRLWHACFPCSLLVSPRVLRVWATLQGVVRYAITRFIHFKFASVAGYLISILTGVSAISRNLGLQRR